jgi:hypothetical protein
MAKYKILIVLVVCFSVALAGQGPSYMPLKIPLPKPGMTAEEQKEEVRKAIEQHKRQERERDKEYMDLMARQAWIRLLRVSESQWNLINPKSKKANDLSWDVWIGAGFGGRDMESFHWNKPSDTPQHPMEFKSRDQWTEGYIIVEELIELLEDEKSTDESIREKIDALQQVREKARKALPKAKQELSKVLTTPRQEAVFLLLGDID